ncbi:MAG: cardiolipin synthase [Xanthomonadales bacterium]|nr:cardiolipin synthase [Xanthomonadales bacterium]
MPATTIWIVVYTIAHLAVIVRAITLPDREPASRAAWVLVLVFVPVVGIVAYLLFGEPWVARRFRRKANAATVEMASAACTDIPSTLDAVPDRFRSVFKACALLGDGRGSSGNRATLAADSNAAIDAMVRDFDQARETIHLSFYIWLADHNGLKVVDALRRAATRGVTCRVVADQIGSQALIRSEHWEAMRKAGVGLCASMKLSLGLQLVFGSRIDLRNHRKIVVVDNRIAYCGSQNCADPEFRIKAKFAPWVDIMLRFEGPVVLQNQRLFATHWMVETGEDAHALYDVPEPGAMPDGFPAIAFGTGPMSPKGAMTDVFVALLYAAEREVVISTPYFVPDAPLLAALTFCARRGVATTLILPARNDSWEVSAISKAHYPQLVEAGVRVFEFRGGLLHAKTLVVDRTVALVGSANMDRRSLDLNFENNTVLCSPEVSAEIRARQDTYLAAADAVSTTAVLQRPLPQRIWENVITMFGPLF